MTTPLLLAIDNGSQSTKVLAVEPDGHVVASARRPLRPYDLSVPGHVVHPGDDVWESIAAACRDIVGQLGSDASRIAAVGLCTIRFCRAYLDRAGHLVEPLLSWMDARVSRPFDAADSRVAYVTTSSGYITHRLTGRFVDTRANYQGLWPIDVTTGEWSSDDTAYAETGMPRSRLVALVSPGDLLGMVTVEAASATGIAPGIPVYATANDKAVEALGCGLTGPDRVLLSLGTYIAGMTVGDQPVASDPAYWANFGSQPGQYLYESHGIRRGMWTVSWFRDLVGGDADGAGVSTEVLDAEAELVGPGAGGVMAVLDWLAPTEAPFRRGALLGFDGTQGRGHIHRAILEGIVLTMREHIVAMERALGQRFDSLIVSGGGSRADVTMQIVADVFERPAVRTHVMDGAGMGAAMCAAVGSGIHPDWATAVERMVRPGATFTPGAAGVGAYRDVARVYAQLTEYTDPLFRMMAATETSR